MTEQVDAGLAILRGLVVARGDRKDALALQSVAAEVERLRARVAQYERLELYIRS